MSLCISIINEILNKCINHEELDMLFTERPILIRQTNDYSLQETLRKKAYNKYYLFHLHNYIILFGKLKHYYHNNNKQNKQTIINITHKYTNINECIYEKINKYLYYDVNTFPYKQFVIYNYNYVNKCFINYKITKTKLALMIINQYYIKDDYKRNNNFIRDMRKLDIDNTMNNNDLIATIRSIIVYYELDYMDDRIDIPRFVDSIICFI